MKLRLGYGLAALLVFAAEIIIFLFVRDGFVRPYLGDAFAVILIYLALRTVAPVSVGSAALLTLLIAVSIEMSQGFRLTERLGLSGHPLAEAVLGSAFDVKDLLFYALGAAGIVAVEALRREPLY